MELSWIEISEKALIHNLKTFRGLIGKDVILAPTVKANAYGHGLVECAKILEKHCKGFLKRILYIVTHLTSGDTLTTSIAGTKKVSDNYSQF